MLTSSYSPDRDAHDYQNDLTNEVANGNGYTTGGATLAGCAMSYVPAASATAWATGTAYKVGNIRRKTATNGFVYRCSVAGTSHATTEPTWPTTVGATVTDNGITWTCVGRGYVKIDADDPSWANSSITARYAAIYDSTPGSTATNPLLFLVTFAGDETSASGTFTITFDADGIYLIPIE